METFYILVYIGFSKIMNNWRDMLKGGTDGSPEVSMTIPAYLQVQEQRKREVNFSYHKFWLGQPFVTTKLAHVFKKKNLN